MALLVTGAQMKRINSYWTNSAVNAFKRQLIAIFYP